MNKIINLGNEKQSISMIKLFKVNDYVPFDIPITNSHITEINNKIGRKIFKKDTLYINSHTLWEIMQPIGGKGNHNYHELTEEDVYMALTSLKDPRVMFVTKNDRYSFITNELSHFSAPLMVIVELNSSLILNIDADTNKVITIYPKDEADIKRILTNINKNNLLYPKDVNKKKK